jgi:hypothetical protein
MFGKSRWRVTMSCNAILKEGAVMVICDNEQVPHDGKHSGIDKTGERREWDQEQWQ